MTMMTTAMTAMMATMGVMTLLVVHSHVCLMVWSVSVTPTAAATHAIGVFVLVVVAPREHLAHQTLTVAVVLVYRAMTVFVLVVVQVQVHLAPRIVIVAVVLVCPVMLAFASVVVGKVHRALQMPTVVVAIIAVMLCFVPIRIVCYSKGLFC
mmetsp:Transcript_2487/g.4589  ORF Transcript_2487/g.4589 Transcript_2487/m.4589 type:complete len:152 (+) Transcript_2487:192-647(+)